MENKPILELTPDQLSSLKMIEEGADVVGYYLAKTLREIERIRPELIYITTCKGDYGVNEQRPYFGAIATKQGKEYLEKHFNNI